jgi:hypothetical protein
MDDQIGAWRFLTRLRVGVRQAAHQHDSDQDYSFQSHSPVIDV